METLINVLCFFGGCGCGLCVCMAFISEFQRRGPRADHVVFHIGPLKRKEARMSQSLTTTPTTQRRVSASFRDTRGIERPVTNITWSSDNPSIAKVTMPEGSDGTVVTILGGTASGRAVISVTADPLPGGVTLQGQLLVDNADDVASQVVFEIGDLEPQP